LISSEQISLLDVEVGILLHCHAFLPIFFEILILVI